MKTSFHEDFYSFAKYYDIAFDFKDVPKECNFIEQLYLKHSNKNGTSFIEFAAGPALHALEFGKRGLNVAAADPSAEMAAYGLQKAEKAGVRLKYDCADMIHYRSSQKYDVASILMDSTSYLLTNEQVIVHFQSVAKILNPGGLYVLEMSHPRSVFQISQSTVLPLQAAGSDLSLSFEFLLNDGNGWGSFSRRKLLKTLMLNMRILQNTTARCGAVLALC